MTELSLLPSFSEECTIVLPSPICFEVDKRYPVKAVLSAGTPLGGQFEWTLPGTEGTRRIKMFGPGLSDSVILEGLRVSDKPNDTEVYVHYTTPGGTTCIDYITLTVAETCE